MNKSKLDILVERRVLTEKHTIASKAIDKYMLTQPGRFQFITELDSNKLSVFSYPNDKEVDIYISIILKNLFIHRTLAEAIIGHIKNQKHSTFNAGTFNPVYVEEFLSKHTLFTYKITVGGTTVLSAMINDTLINFLTIEALKIEKLLIDYG